MDLRRLFQTDVVVLVDGNRIRSVGKSAIPVEAKVIDLSRATVMRGLADSHTHMFLHGIPYNDAILSATRALSIPGGYNPYGYSPDVQIPQGAQLVESTESFFSCKRSSS